MACSKPFSRSWLRFTAGLIFLCSVNALADRLTAQLTVTATVIASCSSISASPLAFGNYTTGGGAVDAQSAVAVTCGPGTAYTVRLAGAAPLARSMSGAGGALQYATYQNAERTLPWGNDAGLAKTGMSTGTAQVLPLYGRIPGGQ